MILSNKTFVHQILYLLLGKIYKVYFKLFRVIYEFFILAMLRLYLLYFIFLNKCHCFFVFSHLKCNLLYSEIWSSETFVGINTQLKPYVDVSISKVSFIQEWEIEFRSLDPNYCTKASQYQCTSIILWLGTGWN